MEEGQKMIKKYEQKLPLFTRKHNPNHDIFVVPTLEGADKDDQWNGSIGDAVMEHMHSMRHRDLEMQHFIHMRDGTIMRMNESVRIPDATGAKYIEKQIMQVMHDQTRTPDERKALIDAFEQEIQENEQRLLEQPDVLDHENVNFDTWEQMPAIEKQEVSIGTPKPEFHYSGNSRQMFYDYAPEQDYRTRKEDHPDGAFIRSFISFVNKIDHNDFTEEKTEYLINHLQKYNWKIPTAEHYFINFCIKVRDNNTDETPDDLMIIALQGAESDWHSVDNKRILSEFRKTPPVQKMLQAFHANKKNFDRGEFVWDKLGSIGKYLFEHKDEVSSAHWNKYFDLKKKFAPRLMIEDIDLNRSDIKTLTKFFSKKYNKREAQQKANQIFFARPFANFQKVVSEGFIKSTDITGTNKNSVLVNIFHSAAQKSIEYGTLKPLFQAAHNVINYQKKAANIMTVEEWSTPWQVYRMCVEEVKKELNIK